jgi:DNA-binding CsgD family transcriptional regulator
VGYISVTELAKEKYSRGLADGFQGRVVRVAKMPRLYGAKLIQRRDLEIERLVGEGRSSREIGAMLKLNPASVRRIRKRLRDGVDRKKVEIRRAKEACLG